MSLFETPQILSLIGIGCLIVIAILGIQLRWWHVESFLEFGPYFIIIGIFALFGLGFKKPLINLYHRHQRTKLITNETSESETVIEVVQKIGQPVRIDHNKIQHYESRDQVDFIQLLNLAKKEIRMSGLSFSLLTLNHSRLISQLAS